MLLISLVLRLPPHLCLDVVHLGLQPLGLGGQVLLVAKLARGRQDLANERGHGGGRGQQLRQRNELFNYFFVCFLRVFLAACLPSLRGRNKDEKLFLPPTRNLFLGK